ncbi:MAG: hypothetical protein ACJ79A_07140 [Gemmatimonadaceae bacterium]
MSTSITETLRLDPSPFLRLTPLLGDDPQRLRAKAFRFAGFTPRLGGSALLFGRLTFFFADDAVFFGGLATGF